VNGQAAAVPTLTGRVAIVTGGSSGIGCAIAETLSAAQARVVIAARTIGRLEEAAAAISERTGQSVDAIVCDTRDRAASIGLWRPCSIATSGSTSWSIARRIRRA
jgi:NAD(P)-dependent dehydrogenase (short-subunit alcohol dehydrogenase family)